MDPLCSRLLLLVKHPLCVTFIATGYCPQWPSCSVVWVNSSHCWCEECATCPPTPSPFKDLILLLSHNAICSLYRQWRSCYLLTSPPFTKLRSCLIQWMHIQRLVSNCGIVVLWVTGALRVPGPWEYHGTVSNWTRSTADLWAGGKDCDQQAGAEGEDVRGSADQLKGALGVDAGGRVYWRKRRGR